MRTDEHERAGLSSALSRLTESVARLIADHAALARAEMREDVRALGLELLVVGYALLCVALALALSSLMGSGWSFALVGAVNLLVGGVAIAIAARRLRRTDVMDDSRTEVERSARLFRQTVGSAGAVERRLGA
jgi:uncharacterized membrane protein YqjE